MYRGGFPGTPVFGKGSERLCILKTNCGIIIDNMELSSKPGRFWKKLSKERPKARFSM
jgi:hypothetical protein